MAPSAEKRRPADRFGPSARAYATYRPRYPDTLFEHLASLAGRRRLAWDCGTGNGQAAVALASHFERVVATDASAGQLEAADRADRVLYVRATAEVSPLATGSVDVVTVAQALHWFDTAVFFDEVRRVLATDGLVAVWCYELPSIGPGIDEALRHFHSQVVRRYWAPERRHVEDRYRSIAFPFAGIAMQATETTAELTLDELLGYVGTWSATRTYIADRAVDPIPALRERIRAFWPDVSKPRTVCWRLAVRAGRPA